MLAMYRQELLLKQVLFDALTRLHAGTGTGTGTGSAAAAPGPSTPTSKATSELYLSSWLLEPYLQPTTVQKVLDMCTVEME